MQRQHLVIIAVAVVALVVSIVSMIAITADGQDGEVGLGARGTRQPLDSTTRLTAPDQWRRQWAELDHQMATLPRFPGPSEIRRDVGGTVRPSNHRLSASLILYIVPVPPRPFEEVLAFYQRELRAQGWTVSPSDDTWGQGLAFTRGGFSGRLVPGPQPAPQQPREGFIMALMAPPEPLATPLPAAPSAATPGAAAATPALADEATGQTTMVYREAAPHRRAGTQLIAGRDEDFAMPSVTRLTDAGIFLVRTSAGFLALIDEDPHLQHPTAWNAAHQRFISPAHAEVYDWHGICMGGPCPRGLDRHPVAVPDGLVIIDTGTRVQGPRLPVQAPGPTKPQALPHATPAPFPTQRP